MCRLKEGRKNIRENDSGREGRAEVERIEGREEYKERKTNVSNEGRNDRQKERVAEKMIQEGKGGQK